MVKQLYKNTILAKRLSSEAEREFASRIFNSRFAKPLIFNLS